MGEPIGSEPESASLDVDHRAELQRGGAMLGFPDAASETPKEFDQQIVNGADEYWTGPGNWQQDLATFRLFWTDFPVLLSECSE